MEEEQELEGWDYNDSFKAILDDSSSSDSDSDDEETDVNIIDAPRGINEVRKYTKIILTEEELLPDPE